MKISVIIKRLSNPRVRKRLKIALSVYGIGILLAIIFKVTYDAGYFKAQSDELNKKAQSSISTDPVLTLKSAQLIVSGALKEDPTHPQTIVNQIVDNNPKLSSLIIEKNNLKRIAWIIDMHLLFTGDLINEEGHNLSKSIARRYNINGTED